MNITIRQLEVFAAIAASGNVTKASDALHLSQSAASMALAELERILEQKLFDRSGKRLLLNEQGRALLPKARECIARLGEIEGMFSQSHKNHVGIMRIGASSTIGNYLLPALFGQYADDFPGVELSLTVGNTDQIIDALLTFSIDLGFIEGHCHHPKIKATPWKTDELVVFASPDHPLAKSKPTLDDLVKSKWILRERGSGTRDVFENAVAGKIDALTIAFELGHTEAIKHAVKHNLGISCLSRLTIAESLANGSLVAIETPFLDLNRYFYRLIHVDKYKSRLLESFISFI